MNYRHAYHAGNFADVFKHVVLTLVIEHLKAKPAPFRVLDTHAGIGRYDLTAEEAVKTGEWQRGVGQLLGPNARALPPVVAQILAPYLDVVRAENPVGQLRYYPGSPLIARRLLRPFDRLIATELHPVDCAALAKRFQLDSQTKVIELDGWLTLKAFLPPKERRAVVLIDPPYELRDDLARMITGLAAAVRRFESGVYLMWYPIKDPREITDFHAALRVLGTPKTAAVELLIRAPRDPAVLNGCGLILLNAPWTLPAALALVLPVLAERLAVAAGGGYTQTTISC